MELKVGSVVFSKAGRDQGTYLVVLEVQTNGILVVDGKERPIERPKKKNIRHIAKTNYEVPAAQRTTNREIRRALRALKHEEVN